MKYDDASWHYGGNFPQDSPEEYGATHIALFLKWCFEKGLASELHLMNEPDAVRAVIDGTMSATEFFLTYCDEKLTHEDFNDAGREFADQYYGDDGLYLHDYANNFAEQMYLAPESEHDYSMFSEIMQTRWDCGILTFAQAERE